MAKDCLVKQYKKVVDNPNLKKLGEVKINLLASDGTVSYDNALEIVLSDTVQYECSAGITNLQRVNVSLVPQETLPLSGELGSGRRILIWTGSGYIKIREKYKFTTLVYRTKNVIDDMSDLKISSMSDGFGIQWDSKQAIDPLVSPTAFNVNNSNNICLLPAIKNCNFDNIVIAGWTENSKLRLAYFTDAGYELNLQGNLANLASFGKSIDRIQVKDIGANRNFYISDFTTLTPVCANVCTHIVVVGSNAALNDQNPSELATWKALRSLNYKVNNAYEWKPIFDAWNAMSEYRGATVEIYLNGTYNGDDIANLHHVVFDDSSSYTVTA